MKTSATFNGPGSLNVPKQTKRIRLVISSKEDSSGHLDDLQRLIDILKGERCMIARFSGDLGLPLAKVPCGMTILDTVKIDNGVLTTDASFIEEPENVCDDDLFILMGK